MLYNDLREQGRIGKPGKDTGSGRTHKRGHIHFTLQAIDEADVHAEALERSHLDDPPRHPWPNGRRYGNG